VPDGWEEFIGVLPINKTHLDWVRNSKTNGKLEMERMVWRGREQEFGN
jgi:hypothetical protein